MKIVKFKTKSGKMVSFAPKKRAKKNPAHKAKKRSTRNPQKTVASILGSGMKKRTARVYTNDQGKAFATGKGLLHKGQRINPSRKAKKHTKRYHTKKNPALGILGKVGDMAQDGLAALGGLVITKWGGRQINALATRFKIPVLDKPMVSQGLIVAGFGFLSASKIKVWRKEMMFAGSLAGFGHTTLIQFLPAGNPWYGKEILAGVGDSNMTFLPVPEVTDGYVELPQVGDVQQLQFDGYVTEAVVEGYVQNEMGENVPVYRLPEGDTVNGLDGYVEYVKSTVGEDDAPGGASEEEEDEE